MACFRWDPQWSSWSKCSPDGDSTMEASYYSPWSGNQELPVCKYSLEGLGTRHQKTTLATGFTSYGVLQEMFVFVSERSPAVSD